MNKIFIDNVCKAIENRFVYITIRNHIYRMEIIHVSWFDSCILARHGEGWISMVNIFDYGKTWSLYRNALVKRRKKYDRKRRQS